jgi:predicted nucleic acid-binding protein
MDVIANTTILSNFASVGELELLHDLLGDIHISVDIYAEIQDGLAEGSTFYQNIDRYIYPFSETGWLRLTSVQHDAELLLLGQLTSSLHRGEASSIAIAAHRGFAFLTDDAKAQSSARSLGISISGTLGILIRSVTAGLLESVDADSLLGKMIQAGYHSPYSTISELL